MEPVRIWRSTMLLQNQFHARRRPKNKELEWEKPRVEVRIILEQTPATLIDLSFKMTHQNTRTLSSSISELNYRSVQNLGNDPISILLKDAFTKVGHKPVGNPDAPKFVADPMASMIEININDKLDLPVAAANALTDMFFSREELRLAVAKASTYLQAGVSLAVMPDPFKDNYSGNPGALLGHNQFATVTPLVLQNIAEGQELTPVASPIKFQDFKFAEVSSSGVQFSISRRTAKDTPFLQLHGMIYKSIAEGIAHAIDAAIAAKIAASTPAAFTLAAAATAKVKTGEIKGITDGTSAKATMLDGELYLNGFNAELCASSGNYLIVPKFWSVAIPEQLRLIVKRELDGSLEFTLFTDLTALATADSLVWSVA